MKLADVKKSIEKYFKEIDPDELYEKALSYGFKEIDNEAEIDSFKDIFETEMYSNYEFLTFDKEKESSDTSKYENEEFELLGIAA